MRHHYGIYYANHSFVHLASLSLPLLGSSSSSSDTLEIQRSGNNTPPSVIFNDDESVELTWQDTDTLTNKTIPLYNFFRAFYYDNLSIKPEFARPTLKDFDAFPTANKSSGSIMRVRLR